MISQTERCFLLKRAIHDKDRDALSKLHAIYYQSIKHFFLSHVDFFDAEDLAQNVFLELCKGHCFYDGKRDVEAYLVGIAKKLIAIYYRNQSKQVKTIPIELSCLTDVWEKIEAELLYDEIQHLKDIIIQLPTKTKEAIKLKFVEGLSTIEAAKLIDCPGHVFRQRIYEAKKAIKKLRTDSYKDQKNLKNIKK